MLGNCKSECEIVCVVWASAFRISWRRSFDYRHFQVPLVCGVEWFGISWVSGCFRCCEVRIPFSVGSGFCGSLESRTGWSSIGEVSVRECVCCLRFWRFLEDFGFLRICGKRIFDRPMWIRWWVLMYSVWLVKGRNSFSDLEFLGWVKGGFSGFLVSIEPWWIFDLPSPSIFRY
jgi:hypothetical protein